MGALLGLILAMLAGNLAPAARITPTTTVASHAVEAPGNCTVLVDELARQGAPAGDLGLWRRIAKRESGCYPRQVHDRDDWSFSRFGLNGLTAGLRDYWRRLCGADVRWDTRILEVDVRCALAARRDLGWDPWRPLP